jgi:multicomponent Na+:H+ antiporter subunit C
MPGDAFLAGVIGVLFAAGVYLMVSRNLIRVLLGFLLVGHGTNLLLLAAGTWGAAPIVGESGGPAGEADPLPQAFVLTSIVITLAVCCFLLAMVFRSYQLTRRAELQTDPEDVLVEAGPGGAE